ncbi:hypothetical protein [Celeribacter indicus]|uniref:hypothetical protein n=1 Tax=Celeribacter indicus TaxID=1208324 RepID=UPI00130E79E9|nr:hypothetical protein [Celeribacter indicus]
MDLKGMLASPSDEMSFRAEGCAVVMIAALIEINKLTGAAFCASPFVQISFIF